MTILNKIFFNIQIWKINNIHLSCRIINVLINILPHLVAHDISKKDIQNSNIHTLVIITIKLSI